MARRPTPFAASTAWRSALFLGAFALATAPAGAVQVPGAPRTPASSREDSEKDAAETPWQAIVRTMHLTRRTDAPPVRELASQIAAHVDAELGRVLEILHSRTAPPLADERPLRLSVVQQELLELAVAMLPRERVSAELERFVGDRAGQSIRRLRIQVGGCVGGAEQLPALCELALREDETALGEDLEAVLRPAFARILERHAEDAHEWFLRQWKRLPPPLLLPLVLALGDADDPAGVECLGSIAAWSDELAHVAIAQVRAIGPSPQREVNLALIEALRRRVDRARTDRLQTIVLVMGELGDFDSVPLLLELLGGEHEGLRDAAHWALRRMTRLSLPASLSLWQHWYRTELRWTRYERDEVLARLRSPLRHDAVAAAQEIAKHRYDRHALAEASLVALDDPDPEVRLAVCRTLAALESLPTADELRPLLDDPDPRVAAAAASALRAITRESGAVREPDTVAAAD